MHKLRIYGREGVGHAWLINPVQRTVEVLRLEQGRWIVAATCGGEEEKVAIEPLEAVPLELARIWPG